MWNNWFCHLIFLIQPSWFNMRTNNTTQYFQIVCSIYAKVQICIQVICQFFSLSSMENASKCTKYVRWHNIKNDNVQAGWWLWVMYGSNKHRTVTQETDVHVSCDTKSQQWLVLMYIWKQKDETSLLNNPAWVCCLDLNKLQPLHVYFVTIMTKVDLLST